MSSEMEAILSEFALFHDWEDRYAYLIDLGRKLPPLDEPYRRPENLVAGCTSQVWLVIVPPQEDSDRCFFQADSDTVITKGLIALLLRIYSGHSFKTIKSIAIKPFFASLGLENRLSPSRTNGFFAIVKRILILASKRDSDS